MHARVFFVLSAVIVALAGGRSAPAERHGEVVYPRSAIDRITASADPLPLARALGMRSLMGKPLGPGPLRSWATRNPGRSGSAPRRRPPRNVGDAPITDDPRLTENQVSLVTHPDQESTFVAAYVGFSFPGPQETRCAVRTSLDAGRTWSEPVLLPLRSTAISCGGPVLAYSADGRRLYVAYQDRRYHTSVPVPLPGGDGYTYRSEGDSDIVVSVSSDQGRTWSSPAVALDGEPWEVRYTCTFVPKPGCTPSDEVRGSDHERASLAVSTWSDGTGDLYVTGTRFSRFNESSPPTAIAFSRSSNGGFSWSPPTLVDFTVQDRAVEIVQGAEVAAGRDGRVLVAWYHPSDDGRLEGRFEIRTRYSPDGGDSWEPVVPAAIDEHELGLWLGPDERFKLWWTAMFPRLVLDRDGRAHIAYTSDGFPGHDTAEEGDIRYITSGAAPHDAWSFPETVNDDGEDRAQGFPSVVVRHQRTSTIVDVIWEDTRRSPTGPGDSPAAANLFYDIFHSWRAVGRGAGWTPNRRVSNESSIQSDLITSGTSLAFNDVWLFGAWVDRRNLAAINQLGEDVYGSGILRARTSRRAD